MKCCETCKYCRIYPGDYWTPDDYDCTNPEISSDELDEFFSENRPCPYYEEAEVPDEYEY